MKNNTKQQSIDFMKSLKPIQNKINKVFDIVLHTELGNILELDALKTKGYNVISIDDIRNDDTLVKPNMLLFTPEDYPGDTCYYTPDVKVLHIISFEKYTKEELEKEPDYVFSSFHDVKSLIEYSKYFENGILAVDLN